MRNFMGVIALIVLSGTAMSDDLFDGHKLRKIEPGEVVKTNDTLAGYPIYQGASKWRYVGSNQASSGGSADTVPMGSIEMIHVEDGKLVASQFVSASFANNNARGWNGQPCSTGHLIILNKGGGFNDNCLTVDPISVPANGKQMVLLHVKVTSSASSGRLYVVDLLLNQEFLGVEKASEGDWKSAISQNRSDLTAILANVAAWGEKLQDASNKLMSYDKPQDVFDSVPSYSTLFSPSGAMKARVLKISDGAITPPGRAFPSESRQSL
jgi:hypothetical protein